MNNLHRELAPISDQAWAAIEEEASRTLKRHLAARRVVDVPDPKGLDLSAIGTGHIRPIQAPGDGVEAAQRDAKAIVELRVPFELTRQAIDDVARGAADSDWSPVKEAARRIAFAEDRAVFDGYAAAGIQGIRQGSSNAAVVLPANARGYPGAVAQAVSRLRLAGVNGPYALVLGADAYTAASGGSDEGYPVFHHIEREVDGGIVWAPAIKGGFVLTTRGGDFELDIGQDVSIGYSSHSATAVELYFLETFTFRLLTTEAAVVLAPEEKKQAGA
ncbi:MAG TPA: family 1 encapsulin nanocompartment shell protein [Hyphomicrobiales bacterium]|nr:family 1 encapsulin nanocompartment shell protein [Hyphomicrobiales bacterium]